MKLDISKNPEAAWKWCPFTMPVRLMWAENPKYVWQLHKQALPERRKELNGNMLPFGMEEDICFP